jgi:hypothetical protein
MKIVHSSRRRHYAVKVGIFLLVLAFVAGMIGCNCVRYDLTIASSGPGWVEVPGEGTFAYAKGGAVVGLVAFQGINSQFVEWTGDVGTIADVNSAQTTITMNGDYNIIANFEEPQYRLYIYSSGPGSVTVPIQVITIYTIGTWVDLIAEAEVGYSFVSWTGDVSTIDDVNDAITRIAMYGDYSITANFGADIAQVAAGGYHTVGLTSTGIMVAAGPVLGQPYYYGQCDVGSWTNIKQCAAGAWHTVGLEDDGTVVAVGDNYHGQRDVGNWTDIIQVAAAEWHTVGLKSDGTVVAVGNNDYEQCDVNGWTGMAQVAAHGYTTIGLSSNGTVVAVGNNDYEQCDVDGWTDIIQVAVGGYHTVGLCSNGTVVATGGLGYGECDVDDWTGIVQVAAGGYHTVGLMSDGTVVAVGPDGGIYDHGQCGVVAWTGIVQVAAGGYHTVGLMSDGTVVAAGRNSEWQCNVDGW